MPLFDSYEGLRNELEKRIAAQKETICKGAPSWDSYKFMLGELRGLEQALTLAKPEPKLVKPGAMYE